MATLYVCKTSSRGFNFGLFRRLSAPFHSCVRENRFTALHFHPPTHSGTPLCPFVRARTTVNLKPERERKREGSYEPRKEVNAKVLILLGTNTAWNRTESI